jgi:hypothetical protein
MAAGTQAAHLMKSMYFGNINFEKTKDPWGGSFHYENIEEDTYLVWCNGPDNDNDEGNVLAFKDTITLEEHFSNCFSSSLLTYCNWLLWRCCVFEAGVIWGLLDGDIIWLYRHEQGLFLLTEDMDASNVTTYYPSADQTTKDLLRSCLQKFKEH